MWILASVVLSLINIIGLFVITYIEWRDGQDVDILSLLGWFILMWIPLFNVVVVWVTGKILLDKYRHKFVIKGRKK